SASAGSSPCAIMASARLGSRPSRPIISSRRVMVAPQKAATLVFLACASQECPSPAKSGRGRTAVACRQGRGAALRRLPDEESALGTGSGRRLYLRPLSPAGAHPDGAAGAAGRDPALADAGGGQLARRGAGGGRAGALG